MAGISYRFRRSRAAFTLVEMLVVIAIIMILAGILFAVIGAVMNRTAILRTNTAIGAVRNSLQQFHDEFQRYPWAKPQDVKLLIDAGKLSEVEIRSSRVIAELRGQGTINSRNSYLSASDTIRFVDLGDGPVLVDGWGHEIFFRVNPNGLEPVIWSCGRDGRDQTNDGVSSDPVKTPQSYYWFGNGDSGDDVISM